MCLSTNLQRAFSAEAYQKASHPLSGFCRYPFVEPLPNLMYVFLPPPMVELHDIPAFAKNSNYLQYHVPAMD